MHIKILHTATEMFLEYGFKSVTMDDLANAIGASKKTIYEHFKTKSDLVAAVAQDVKQKIDQEIDNVISRQFDPINEMIEIKKCIMRRLKNQKSSPQYQLQKYYPKVYLKLRDSQICKMDNCCTENVKRGVDQGFYRDDLNITFVVRSYISGMLNLKDEDLFKSTDLSPQELYEEFLIYHLRSITTQKGKDRLNALLNTN